VLVTGAAGTVGQPVVRELRARGHFVRALDRVAAPFADHALAGDIADAEVVFRAVHGIDAIVHLAANPENGDLIDDLLQPNIVGLWRLLEASRAASVPKLILASSIQVTTGIKNKRLLTGDDAAPINPYALTKRWAEIAGEMHARQHDAAVIMARIGWLPRTRERAEQMIDSDARDIYLSDADAGRFFACAVEADLSPGDYHVLYAIGRAPAEPRVDPAVAQRVIGYEPQHTFPAGYRLVEKD
jgi:uronate dehydrogenase